MTDPRESAGKFLWGLLEAIAEDVAAAIRKKRKPLPEPVKTRPARWVKKVDRK